MCLQYTVARGTRKTRLTLPSLPYLPAGRKEERNLDLTPPTFQGGAGGGYRIISIFQHS